MQQDIGKSKEKTQKLIEKVENLNLTITMRDQTVEQLISQQKQLEKTLN